MHDVEFWRGVISKTPGVEALCIEEMHSRDEVWRDWLTQDNPYATRQTVNGSGSREISQLLLNDST